MAFIVGEDEDKSLLQAMYDGDTWVQVGNLYLSLTMTGNNSWPPIVLKKFAEGHRNFRILSGRHGVQAGGFQLDKHIAKRDADPSHFTQDKDFANFLKTGETGGRSDVEWPVSNLSGENVTITVEDFGKGSRDSLKSTAKAYLDRGDTVIFAWCFSVTAMYLYSPDGGKLEIANATTVSSKSIKSVVASKFDWVKRCTTVR